LLNLNTEVVKCALLHKPKVHEEVNDDVFSRRPLLGVEVDGEQLEVYPELDIGLLAFVLDLAEDILVRDDLVHRKGVVDGLYDRGRLRKNSFDFGDFLSSNWQIFQIGRFFA